MAVQPKLPKPVEPQARPGFDEQAWPVNLTLLISAAIVGALIVTRGDFNTHRWLQNGFVQLGALAIGVVLLIWGEIKLSPRAQRRMQLAVLLSLMLHFWASRAIEEIYTRFPSLAVNPAVVQEQQETFAVEQITPEEAIK